MHKKRIEEINARLSAISQELENATGDALTALETEVSELTAERNKLMAEAQTRSAMRNSIAAGAGMVIESRTPAAPAAGDNFTLASPEYRSAFLKNLRGEDMTDVEKRAFTFLTTNTSQPLPTEMQNRIIDLIGEQHPIVADVFPLESGTSISIPVAKTIVSDAGTSTEGGAANEMEIAMDTVDLSGDDFTANVKLSYKMAAMAIPAFESYLISKISERLGAKLAADIVAKIKAGVAAGNKITTGVTYANICAGFGALKRVGTVVVYCTRSGLYNKLVAMVDQNKRPIFQQPITAEAAGTLLGCQVKFEDAVGDNELLIGDAKKYVQNTVHPIIIETDRDLDNHKITYSGYTCQEGALTDDKAFAVVADAA